MGRDKAFVPVDGTPMVAHVANALRGAGCDPIVAVGGDHAKLAALDLAVVADRWPGEGPLGGIITALEHLADGAVVVIVACDLPHTTAPSIVALIDALASSPADVAIATGQRAQPLCAAWRPRASTQLADRFAAGERRVVDAVSRLHVVSVPVPVDQLLNVNTDADLPR